MPSVMNMRVIKRDGRREPVSFDKVLRRLHLLSTGIHKNGVRFAKELDVDVTPLSQKVIQQIRDGITTKELDEFAASTCANLVKDHPDYSDLAGRIIISNNHKNTGGSFADTIKYLYANKDTLGKPSPLINTQTYKVVIENREYLESIIDYNRDFLIDYFGFKTLERSYLLKSKAGHFKVQERPQHMYLRVSVGIHGDDLQAVKETYDLLSLQKLSHASPTLYNAGTPHMQMSSCFLLGMDDSLSGIYDCLKKCAMISKHAGGIGIWAHRVRAKGSKIRGTNGESDGLIPMLRVFNETARYVNQGGKRKGSIAVYLEPHHADIEDFLDLKKTHGDMNRRALDLFLAMWISDLFMKRLDKALPNDKSVMWSLFCPDEAPGLEEVYGEEYERLYTKYENEKIYRRQVPIIDIWEKILAAQKETGVPYMLYKDCVNYRNPQMNIGVVKSSNLCAEIALVNDPKDETISVCNLCAVPLGSFIKIGEDGKKEFDFEELGKSVKVGIQNLNKIIDLNFYPVQDCANSNFRDRPVGLGVVGLYDAFIQLRYPFESDEARKLNREIFECIYYHAARTSMELAKQHGPYETFAGSPASQGKLQIDLWNEDRVRYGHDPVELCGRYDWDQLREDIKEHGMRNSTLIACMPTASTAQILGQTESFECMTYNVYRRQVLSGDFKLVNKYLQRDLYNLGLWKDDMGDRLISARGSIQEFEEIPDDLKKLYKGAFEVKQRAMLDLAIERSPFVDQTQSLNLFVSDPTDNVLSSIQMYAFKNRLKTGQYYLRREAKAKAVQFTVRPVKSRKKIHSRLHEKRKMEKKVAKAEAMKDAALQGEEEEEVPLCLLNNPDCEACQV